MRFISMCLWVLTLAHTTPVYSMQLLSKLAVAVGLWQAPTPEVENHFSVIPLPDVLQRIIVEYFPEDEILLTPITLPDKKSSISDFGLPISFAKHSAVAVHFPNDNTLEVLDTYKDLLTYTLPEGRLISRKSADNITINQIRWTPADGIFVADDVANNQASSNLYKALIIGEATDMISKEKYVSGVVRWPPPIRGPRRSNPPMVKGSMWYSFPKVPNPQPRTTIEIHAKSRQSVLAHYLGIKLNEANQQVDEESKEFY